MYSLTFRVRVMLPWQRSPYPDCKSAQWCTADADILKVTCRTQFARIRPMHAAFEYEFINF